ncbi:hypothetical protein F4818DRAFT_263359 [Hypoxylon cercidicola]|nr:hypothetical protein F4818DRAFT_263359 [Hypoxylon cercidicola]
MVVRLDVHQSSREPFGLPWTSFHTRHTDDGPSLGNSSRSRFFRVSASAPTSPPSVFQALKGPAGSSDGGSGTSSGSDGIQNAGRRLAKIQVEIPSCQFQTPSSTPACRPKPNKSNSAPVVLQFPSDSDSQGAEESNDSNNAPPSLFRAGSAAPTRPLTETAPSSIGPCVKETTPKVFCFAPGALTAPSGLPLRPAKRRRALHDVDGPGTGCLSCKKRRLRLHLVTSRLSQPYSLPATHILNRESGDDSPVLSRILRFGAMGALKKAGHQSAIVRKAAILNRVRIGVRQAAVLRGHTVLAGMAARGNSLSHGLQLVTTSNSATSARFPGNAPPYDHPYDLPYPIPPVWRPHTTAFHPPPSLSQISSAPSRDSPTRNARAPMKKENTDPNPPTTTNPSHPPPPSLPLTSSPPKPLHVPSQREEEEDVAFPSPDLETRYADFSDDDLGDVYADFGVLFGSSSASPDGGSGSNEGVGGEHFYEEYLDELDGLRWVA